MADKTQDDMIKSLAALVKASPKGGVQMSSSGEGIQVTLTLKKTDATKEILRQVANAVIEHNV
ncbi:unnamed protein product [Gemmata massiliana]|uniref:Uncharacterized protein n=1 Tax=Gemmata massiliana TaxID=1210884 RepID=A0A6P2CZP2_9BACT|nr:hypothetical protein [Gemmata massiliana]VTR94349.1 unnamed protein product [Gemmata massiliana]